MYDLDGMATPNEQRVLALLGDGRYHTKREIRECIYDEYVTNTALRACIHRLRKKLQPRGEDIICEYRGKSWIGYRWVRLLASPYDE